MTAQKSDIIVLGSGFGGSLLSTLLVSSRLSVVMVDRASHPRFAIGESSTPLANQTLASIAAEFDLPELKPLTRYGSWKTHHSELLCGLKRGFSYFGHKPSQPLCRDDVLMVAASNCDEAADTHWLRSDVDRFFFQLAQKHGVATFENANYELEPFDHGWRVKLLRDGVEINLTAPFVIDATGRSGEVLKKLSVAQLTGSLQTQSSAVFAHFNSVRPVGESLKELNVDCMHHPFSCDAAAVHQVLDNGWMWQLRFDDQSVSAGFAFEGSLPRDTDAQSVWDAQMIRFPSLVSQFRDAVAIRPRGGLRLAPRLQYLRSAAAGENWAALPSTVGFIDPLHSTGIAHTLFGVRRLARILIRHSSDNTRREQLEDYSETIVSEIRFIDELIAGCYAALPNFRLWSAWCMLYFCAVTSMEQDSKASRSLSFLHANDDCFRSMVRHARESLTRCRSTSNAEQGLCQFEDQLRTLIAPWNHAGLLDPSAGGLYKQTAAPE